MDCTNEAYTLQPDFIQACKLADTPPTKRQASRFRMGKGRAYKVSRIVPQAPPVPSWFEPQMGTDTCPPEFKYLPEIPAESETEEQVKARQERDTKGEEEMAARTAEIAEWRKRHRAQAIAQWPKVWAFRTLRL